MIILDNGLGIGSINPEYSCGTRQERGIFCHQGYLFSRKRSKQPLRYGWWKKSSVTYNVKNLVNSGINYLSTGAEFLPSRVFWCSKGLYSLVHELSLWLDGITASSRDLDGYLPTERMSMYSLSDTTHLLTTHLNHLPSICWRFSLVIAKYHILYCSA